MAGDDPPYLTVGTDVSAKYRGAFCEAKVKKVEKTVKCKVFLKDTQTSVVVSDDCIKGLLKHGETEVKIPDTGHYVEGVINKITDCSMYTVVFDDGDEKTLRRTQLCLKGEKHFIESETLDNLPLSNPEHFGTPVMQNKKAKRINLHGCEEENSDSDNSEISLPRRAMYKGRNQELVGKVMITDLPDCKKKVVPSPVLIVLPDAVQMELKTKDYLLVRSFKDGKFVGIHRKELKDFSADCAIRTEDKAMKIALEKALQFLDSRNLPSNWDHDELLGTDNEDTTDEEDSSDDEPSEEKDRFVAQLYKFMDDRGTPINKGPCIGKRDLNLYKLFKIVQNFGGYNKVTNQMKWKIVYSKMTLPPSNNPAHQIKNAYKKYLHAFEDFYRKLGSTMGTISRPGRNRHSSSRGILTFRGKDKDIGSPLREKKTTREDDTNVVRMKTRSDESKSEMESESEVECSHSKEEISPSKRERILRRDFLKDTELKEVREKNKVENIKETKEESKERRNDKKCDNKVKNIEKIDVKDKKDDLKERKHENTREKKSDKKDESKEKKVECEDIKERKLEKRVESKDKKSEKKGEEERKRPIRKDNFEDKKDLYTKNMKKDEEQKVSKKEEEKILPSKKDEERKVKLSSELHAKASPKDTTDITRSLPTDIVRNLKRREVDEEKGDQKKFGRRRSFRVEENRKDADKTVVVEEEKLTNTDKDDKKKDEPKDKKIDKKEIKKSRTDDCSTKMQVIIALLWNSAGMSGESDSEEDGNEYPVGTKLRVRYGKGKNLKIYEAKVMEHGTTSNTDKYLVHYAGWNNRYDEWIKRDRIVSVVGKPEGTKKKSKIHSPRSPKNQSELVKKRGRPTNTLSKATGETQFPTTSPKSSSEIHSGSTKTKTPGTGKTKARPTRSNSVEVIFLEGLQPKRRLRKASGITEGSDQTSHVSESEESDRSNTDDENMEKDEVDDELDTTKEYDDDLTATEEDEKIISKPQNVEIEETVFSEVDTNDIKCEAVPKMEIVKSFVKIVNEIRQENEDRTKKQKPEDIPENDPYFPDFLLDEAENSHVDVKLEKLEFLDRRMKREFDKKVKKDEFKWELDEMEKGRSESIDGTETKFKVEIDCEESIVVSGEPENDNFNSQPELAPSTQNELNEVHPEGSHSHREPESTKKDEIAESEKKFRLRRENVKEQRKLFERRFSETEISRDRKVFDPPSKRYKEAESVTTFVPSLALDPPILTASSKDFAMLGDNNENDKKKVKKKMKKRDNEINISKLDMKISAKKETGKFSKVRTGAKPGPKPKDIKISQELQDSYSAVIDSVIKNTEQDNIPDTNTAENSSDRLEGLSSQTSSDANVVPLEGTTDTNLYSEPPSGNLPGVSLSLDIAHNQEEQNPDPSTLMENTPPTTPEYFGANLPQGNFFQETEGTPNKEKECFIAHTDNSQPSDGESPAGNVSPRSNESSVGSGNAACSEGSGEIPASLGKRRKDSEDSTLTKKKKRSVTRKGDKKLHKNAGSDSDEACEYMENSSPQHQPTCEMSTTTVTSTTTGLRSTKFNFNLEEGKYLEGEDRITFLINKIQDIRKIYMGLKAEVACIDRRRKRAKRKEKLSTQNQATTFSDGL
ncbi:hypothetical protein ScPMuIL_014529 [Solemya velum]